MPIIRMGLRPIRSEILPQMGPNRNSVNAAVATRTPNALPLAPSLSIRNGKTGTTMPNPSMTTSRANTRMKRFRRLVVFIQESFMFESNVKRAVGREQDRTRFQAQLRMRTQGYPEDR